MLQKLSLVKSVNFLFQVNGTLKIIAREVRDQEKERKTMAKTHLDLVLSSISIVVVVICLILLSCLRCSVSLILRSVTNVPINSKLQYLPWATHWHLTVVRARGREFESCSAEVGHLNRKSFRASLAAGEGGGLNAPIFKSSNAWGDTEASI